MSCLEPPRIPWNEKCWRCVQGAEARAFFSFLPLKLTFCPSLCTQKSNSGAGFDFAIPYLYNGVQFAGIPEYVECADNGNSTGACADTKICAQDGTTHIDVILGVNPDASIVAAVNPEFLYTNFISGFCKRKW